MTAPEDREMLTALLGKDAPSPITEIDPRDEMLVFPAQLLGVERARFDYFRLGHELAETVDQVAAWAFGDAAREAEVLEFASGYGRILRHLVLRYDHVTASDIDPEAMASVAAHFGVPAKLSVEDPDDLDWPERYDLIVVPSLFSHLPDATFGRWLATLARLLTPRGVLAFSVHGDQLHEGEMPESGIVFQPISEATGRLDEEVYGTSFVTEQYVVAQVRAAIGTQRYARVLRGFWEHQDLYLVTGPEAPDPQTFTYRRPIMGSVDVIDGAGDQLRLAGWVHAESGTPTLRVLRAGDVLAERTELIPRPDVAALREPSFLDSGFDVTVALPADADGLLVVEAQTATQRRCLLAAPVTALPGRTAPEPEPEPVAAAPRRRLWRRRG